MKRILLACFMLAAVLVSTNAWAQDRTVTGRVTDAADGLPLPQVSILLKGTGTGVATDTDGNYRMSVPSAGGTLVFRYVGYKPLEVEIGNQTVINIQMEEDANQLGEVVVVGYGTQSRRKITGAIASTGSESLENIPVADPLQAIQGRIAGVEISGGSGRPGAPQTVRVRGVASIGNGAANSPLYVVDGVPISNTNDFALGTGGGGYSPISSINPDDILSIEVLKDASASAIYGSRASNGVILITTKKGDFNQSTQFNVSYSVGVQELTNSIDFLDANQFRAIMRESRANTGLPVDPQFADDPTLQTTNWIEEIQRENPIITNLALNASGGSEKTKYFISGNYFKQDAILLKGDFERLSTRINLEHHASDKLSLGFNLQGVRSELFQTTNDNNIFSPWPQANQSRPDEPIFNEDGSFFLTTSNNPIQGFEPENTATVYSVITNTYIDFEIFEGLRFKSSLGVDFQLTENFVKNPVTSFQGAGIGGQGIAATAIRTNWLTENTMTYDTKFLNDRINFNALLGYSYQQETARFQSMTGTGFPSDDFRFLISAATNTAFSANETENRLISYISRINVDMDDKYLLTASLRRDGSSRFGINKRFGWFPAVSLGWRISQEPFFSSITFVDDLKIRASYGQTGNLERLNDFSSLDLIGGGANFANIPGFAPSQLGNPDLTWESADQLDIGLDASFLNNRLNITMDYFNKTVSDLLLFRTLPFETGFSGVFQNIGEMVNKGFEFGVNSVNLDGELKWSTNFNITRLNNEVTELVLSPTGEATPIDNGFVNRTDVGQPVGSFYVIKYLGVDPNTGDALYEDIDNNGVIDQNDRQFLGNAIPDWSGGLTNTLSYKGFDLSIFFSFALGREIYRIDAEGQGGLFDGGLTAAGVGMDARILNRWQNPGDITDVPRVIGGQQGVFNTQRSSRWLEDGDFIRLKNVTLGYTLPNSLTEKLNLRRLRVFVTGQNLWTITDFTGYDPEVSSSTDQRQAGVDQGAIPQLRNYTIGINIGL